MADKAGECVYSPPNGWRVYAQRDKRTRKMFYEVFSASDYRSPIYQCESKREAKLVADSEGVSLPEENPESKIQGLFESVEVTAQHTHLEDVYMVEVLLITIGNTAEHTFHLTEEEAAALASGLNVALEAIAQAKA